MPFSDDIWRIMGGLAGSVAQDLRPRCRICHEFAVPKRCVKCGEFACSSHVWMKIPSLERLEQSTVLCDTCAGAQAPSRVLDHWKFLGVVAKGATPEGVKSAFKEAAKLLHPDHSPEGTQETAARLFSLLQTAKEAALEEVARCQGKTTGSRTRTRTSRSG